MFKENLASVAERGGVENNAEQTALPVVVLKENKTDGTQGVVDSLMIDDDPKNLQRMIRRAAGKKDKPLQSAVEGAVEYISQNPKGSGSCVAKSFDKGRPTYDRKPVTIREFKPTEAQGLRVVDGLRKIRIFYGLVDLPDKKQAVGIRDIRKREGMDKQYN